MIVTTKDVRVVAAFDEFDDFEARATGDPFCKEESFIW
jgi:hypothetical protein